MEQIFLGNLTGSQLVKNSQHFMEPEGSLTHSQVPATCLYPEPDRSTSCSPIPLLEDPSQYNPPIYAWVFLPSGFTTKTLNTHLLSPIRPTRPTHLIFLD